jgi:uncharacterized membrane protein required for colicin V production
LDTWCLVVVAVFALLGLWFGAARQMASLVALACASIASRPLSEAIGPWWAGRQEELSLSTAVLLSFVISFILVGLAVYAMVFFSFRPERKEPTEQNRPRSRLSAFWNRNLGLCLGALKGAFWVWLLLSLAALITQQLNWLPFRLPWSLESSHAYAFAKQHNALNQKQWAKLLVLEKIADLPPYAAELLPMGNPGQLPSSVTQELDKFKKLFDELHAFEKKRFHALLKDKELDKLLSDEPFLKALEDFRNFLKPNDSPPPPPSSS